MSPYLYQVPEAFFTQLKVACFSVEVVSMPILGCQLFAFLVPGLHEYEAKTLLMFLVGSILLFFLGVVFTYSIVLPVAWNFFMLMGSGETAGLTISLEARMEDYVTLFLSIVLAISLAFEIPLIVVACYCAGFIGQEQLIRHRRYAVIFSLIGAAILSPPDLFESLFIAFPWLFHMSSLSVPLHSKGYRINQVGLTELVDVLVLGTSAERRVGSSPIADNMKPCLHTGHTLRKLLAQLD